MIRIAANGDLFSPDTELALVSAAPAMGICTGFWRFGCSAAASSHYCSCMLHDAPAAASKHPVPLPPSSRTGYWKMTDRETAQNYTLQSAWRRVHLVSWSNYFAVATTPTQPTQDTPFCTRDTRILTQDAPMRSAAPLLDDCGCFLSFVTVGTLKFYFSITRSLTHCALGPHGNAGIFWKE